MVRGDTAFETVEPFKIAKHGEIFIEKGATTLIDDLPDLITFVRLGEPHARAENLSYGLIAAGTTEDEEDGRQKMFAVKQPNDFRAIHSPRIELRKLVVTPTLPAAPTP